MTTARSHKLFYLLPLTGFLCFILLYIFAASLYPGGSDADKSAVGFSWLHNYWCELMAGHAQNGQDNIARPVAIAAMFILSMSIGLFWHFASFLFREKTAARYITRYAGVSSMFMLLLLFTGAHDMAMNLSGLLGITAMVFTMTGLYRKGAYKLLRLGVFCLVLCAVNNYIYYSGMYLALLAIIQKFTFLMFLLWFGLVDIYLYRIQRKEPGSSLA